MSPRSAEFLAEASKRLRTARAAIGVEDPAGAVSAAYYAMLYAARAALSEEDRYAKTHAGTWGEFREAFVLPDRFDAALFRLGPKVQELREAADYHARNPVEGQAETVVDDAAHFVAAVTAMIEG